MKEWIRELCPEIDAWQVDLIAQYAHDAVIIEREACARVCEQAGIDGYGTLAAAALIRSREGE